VLQFHELLLSDLSSTGEDHCINDNANEGWRMRRKKEAV
jgi:hypothetical protein